MSTDVALYGDNAPVVADPTGGRLVAWASSLQAAHSIGKALCQTAFVPTHFKGKPEDAAAAILFGDEIGLSPTQALRSVYVISNTPALYARTMVALVLSHGHEVWTVDKTDAKVTVAGRRRGSVHQVEETWTTARANKAGYTKNSKYATDPQAMLYARAAADVCRQIAPDSLAGLAYTVEELEAAEPVATTTVRRTDTSTTTRARRAAPEQAEPDLAPEPEPEPAPAGGITGPQSKMLHALLGQNELANRDDGLAYISHMVGREVDSTKGLTKAEASRVIDSFSADAVPPSDDEPEPAL